MLKPLLHSLLAAAFTLLCLLVCVVIVCSADRLGYFFLPALFCYFAFLSAIGALLYRRKKLRELHGIMGDEVFYEQYPFERRKKQFFDTCAKRIAARKAAKKRKGPEL